MFRYKSHKQAFIMTALVILLCLVSLAGATLALFTSDLNDGTIGIITTSGDVEVDIVDTSGETLQNRALAFMTSFGATDNGDVLFEPGATFYTQGFKVKNVGDVPVKFRLNFNEEGIKDENGDVITVETLLETFEIWITTDPSKPESAMPLAPFVGTLDVEENRESETYYLFIKVKESVGNEFQGKTYTGIGVTVYAVQGNAELN